MKHEAFYRNDAIMAIASGVKFPTRFIAFNATSCDPKVLETSLE
jgi:hypothetical protein